MSERDVAIYMAQVLSHTDQYQDMINFLKKAIEINPVLTNDEQTLLSVAYKNLINVPRAGLRMLAGIMDSDEAKANPLRITELNETKQQLIQELERICNDLISLIGDKLISNTTEPNMIVCYEKLRADYYRYICEFRPDETRGEVADEAKKCYDHALEVAKAESIQPWTPNYLGLILNYTVFLFEVLGQRESALELANNTYKEQMQNIDNNDDQNYHDAAAIMQLLHDNVALWTSSQ